MSFAQLSKLNQLMAFDPRPVQDWFVATHVPFDELFETETIETRVRGPAAAGDEKTGKGGGLWQIAHGKASQIDPTPFYGLVFTHGRLFASGNNQIVSAAWVDGGLAPPKVVFRRPRFRT